MLLELNEVGEYYRSFNVEMVLYLTTEQPRGHDGPCTKDEVREISKVQATGVYQRIVTEIWGVSGTRQGATSGKARVRVVESPPGSSRSNRIVENASP